MRIRRMVSGIITDCFGAEILGYTNKELIGKNAIKELLVLENTTDLNNAYSSANTKTITETLTLRIRHKRGFIVSMDVTRDKHIHPDGFIFAYTCIASPIQNKFF